MIIIIPKWNECALERRLNYFSSYDFRPFDLCSTPTPAIQGQFRLKGLLPCPRASSPVSSSVDLAAPAVAYPSPPPQIKPQKMVSSWDGINNINFSGKKKKCFTSWWQDLNWGQLAWGLTCYLWATTTQYRFLSCTSYFIRLCTWARHNEIKRPIPTS